MVQPIYDLTSLIYVNIVPSHQVGKELGNIGGAAELRLGYLSAHNWVGNQKSKVVEYG